VRLPRAGALLCCALCLASSAPLFAQDSEEPAAPTSSPSSVDDLFKAPQADIETQTSDAQQLLAPFHAQPLSVVGSLSTSAGAVLGYKDDVDSSGAYDGSYRFKANPGLTFVPALTISARPDETIRFQGTVSFPYQSGNYFSPAINEMFVDYTLQDLVYMRIGKHLVSWGVTRIFDVGDLMSGSSDDLNFKVTVPINKGGFTGIMLAPSSIVDSSFEWRELTAGFQADIPFGKSEIIFSGTCFGDDGSNLPLKGTALFKTSLFGVDLFAEGIGASRLFNDNNRPDASSLSPNLTGFVSGFYWNRTDPKVNLYGEYYLDATYTDFDHQFVSVVASIDRAFGSPLNLAMQWTHSFLDSSGIITPGFSVDLLPHIKMEIGLPCRYGAPGSYYLINQSPSVQTSVIPTQVLTWYQRYGFLLRLTMSTSF
jgi:hypothetical protein